MLPTGMPKLVGLFADHLASLFASRLCSFAKW
jgi:hypothetical protein